MSISPEIVSAAVSSVAMVAIPMVLGIIGGWFRNWMIKRGYQTDIFDAAGRAAGIGYSYLVANNKKITDPAALAEALTVGSKYLARSELLPAKLEACGMTKERLDELMHGELGKLLAADPATTVSESAKTQVVNNVVAAVEGVVDGPGQTKKLETLVSGG